MKYYYLTLFIFLFLACKNDKAKSSQNDSLDNSRDKLTTLKHQTALGTYKYSIVEEIDTSYQKLKRIFNNNENVGIVSELNHTKNAKTVGLDLNPTQVIFFGNPKLGTPLMQANPLTGLDLPQKMLFLKDESGSQIQYTDMAYLDKRYALENHQNLSKIDNTLEMLVQKIASTTSVEHTAFETSKHQGIISKKSTHDFKTTLDNLMTVLQNHKALKIIATLDHQENAKKVGMKLMPSFLVVFGNPKMGSPLMQSQQSIALDLPQKMLVWKNADDEVYLSYNDIYFVQQRHQLKEHDDILKKISEAIDKISSEVTM